MEITDFRELLHGSKAVAHELATTILPPPLASVAEDGRSLYPSKNAAVLYASSADYLFLWLGLTQLGFATLHLAYVCQRITSPSLSER